MPELRPIQSRPGPVTQEFLADLIERKPSSTKKNSARPAQPQVGNSSNQASSPTPFRLNLAPTQTQSTTSSQTPSRTQRQTPTQAQNQTTKKEPNLLTRLNNTIQAATDFVHQVETRAEKDRAQGVGLRDGANSFWDEVRGSLVSFGQAAEKNVLNQFSGELETALSDLIGLSSNPLPKSGALNPLTAPISPGSGIPGTTGSALGAGSLLQGAGAAYALYQIIDNFGQSDPVTGAVHGATVGAYIGSNFLPGLGTVAGGLIGAGLGAISGLFSSGKHKDQIARDKVRDAFRNVGFIDSKWSLGLSDGSRYDIGKDGGASLKNMGEGSRKPYQIDLTNPLTPQVIGWMNPLAAVLTGGSEKLKTDFSGYFSNAVISNASDMETARANALAIYDQSGVTPEQVVMALETQRQEGAIDDNTFFAYVNGVKTLLFDAPTTAAAPPVS